MLLVSDALISERKIKLRSTYVEIASDDNERPIHIFESLLSTLL
jgi:hypothetical protein